MLTSRLIRGFVLALVGVLTAKVFVASARSAQQPAAVGPAAGGGSELAVLQAQLDRVKGMVPDQAHAMSDVGYQFGNLWFAGEKRNWPLAKFCLDETRSHLRWAVRIIPVRKTPAGEDLDLKGILDALESSVMSDLYKVIEAHDSARFEAAYKRTLEGCYSCHKASGKPFIRPQVPTAPPASILNFDPEAKWPK
jgi:hypothetical protein